LLTSRAHPDERVNVGGLVAAGEASLVAVPVRGDVLPVPHAQLLDRFLDHLVPALAPHRLGAGFHITNLIISNSRYVLLARSQCLSREVLQFFFFGYL
jgi:hypothetical protein